MYYDYFQHINMIPTSSEELREKLGTPKNEKYVSFADAYGENGEYKLKEYIDAAYQSNPAHRTKFQKDLIKFDEKMGIAYYMYTAQMFLVFPDITGNTTGFLSPGVAMASLDKDTTLKIQDLL